MDNLIMAGTACSTRFKKTYLHLQRILNAPSLLNLIAWKPVIERMHWIHDLRTDILCRITLLSLLSGMSQQCDTRIGKQWTRRFHPVLPGNQWRKILSILDNIIVTVLRRTLTLNCLLSVENVTGIQLALQLQQPKSTHTKTLSSPPICYYQLAVPLHIQTWEIPPSCVRSWLATAYTQRWWWVGKQESDELLEFSLSVTSQSYKKTCEPIHRTIVEQRYCRCSKNLVANCCGVFFFESYSPTLENALFPLDA